MAVTKKPKAAEPAEILAESVTPEEFNDSAEVASAAGDETIIVDDSAAESQPSVKMVEIRPNCNHRCVMGNTTYVLVKDTVMKVPVDVKARLQKAGKLAAV